MPASLRGCSCCHRAVLVPAVPRGAPGAARLRHPAGWIPSTAGCLSHCRAARDSLRHTLGINGHALEMRPEIPTGVTGPRCSVISVLRVRSPCQPVAVKRVISRASSSHLPATSLRAAPLSQHHKPAMQLCFFSPRFAGWAKVHRVSEQTPAWRQHGSSRLHPRPGVPVPASPSPHGSGHSPTYSGTAVQPRRCSAGKSPGCSQQPSSHFQTCSFLLLGAAK